MSSRPRALTRAGGRIEGVADHLDDAVEDAVGVGRRAHRQRHAAAHVRNVLLGDVEIDPEPGRIGDGEQRRLAVGTHLQAGVDGAVDDRAGDRAAQPELLVDAAELAAEQGEAAGGALALDLAAPRIGLRRLDVLARGGAVIVEIAHAAQGLLRRRQIGRGAVGVRLRLAEVGGLDGGERSAPADPLPEIGEHPLHPAADRRVEARGRVLVPGQSAGGADARRRGRRGRRHRQGGELAGVGGELDAVAVEPGGGGRRFGRPLLAAGRQEERREEDGGEKPFHDAPWKSRRLKEVARSAADDRESAAAWAAASRTSLALRSASSSSSSEAPPRW